MTGSPAKDRKQPSFPWHPPTTELHDVRQVSWLAGRGRLTCLPGIAASDIVGDRLTAYSCGTAPEFNRIPS